MRIAYRQVRGDEYEKVVAARRKTTKAPKENSKKIRKRVVYEGDDLGAASDVASPGMKQIDQKALPLSKRIALQKEASSNITQIKGQFGAKEVAYKPKSSRKADRSEETEKTERRERRRMKK